MRLGAIERAPFLKIEYNAVLRAKRRNFTRPRVVPPNTKSSSIKLTHRLGQARAQVPSVPMACPPHVFVHLYRREEDKVRRASTHPYTQEGQQRRMTLRKICKLQHPRARHADCFRKDNIVGTPANIRAACIRVKLNGLEDAEDILIVGQALTRQSPFQQFSRQVLGLR